MELHQRKSDECEKKDSLIFFILDTTIETMLFILANFEFVYRLFLLQNKYPVENDMKEM